MMTPPPRPERAPTKPALREIKKNQQRKKGGRHRLSSHYNFSHYNCRIYPITYDKLNQQ